MWIQSSSYVPNTCRQTALVEEMSFSSALDGVTVSNSGFVDVSMIEEVYAVEKRKANRSGPDSDASDTRTSKTVTQNVQPDQPAEVPVGTDDAGMS
jgi:hypothetical protein